MTLEFPQLSSMIRLKPAMHILRLPLELQAQRQRHGITVIIYDSRVSLDKEGFLLFGK